MMANDPHNIWLKSRNLIKTIKGRVHICIDKLTSTLVIFLLESRICIRLLAFIFEVNKPLYISYITCFACTRLYCTRIPGTYFDDFIASSKVLFLVVTIRTQCAPFNQSRRYFTCRFFVVARCYLTRKFPSQHLLLCVRRHCRQPNNIAHQTNWNLWLSLSHCYVELCE